ncbi:MAG: hypothetical protein AB8B99_05980 [Phormidesmis sp.]
MANPSSPQHNKGSGSDAATPNNAEAELLHSVLVSDAYPWTIDVADEYAAAAEAAGQALEISDEDASQGWQRLSMQLNQMWSGEAEVQSSDLFQTFAGRLSVEMLTRIAEKAKQVSVSGESMVTQMVACAQEVLSGIADTDLQVMARPMAMAMRGRSSDEIVDVTIKSVRAAEWDALSPIEQAKLSLAAARYALAEVGEA